MANFNSFLFLLSTLACTGTFFSPCKGEEEKVSKNLIANIGRGEVQSCEGCQLNRLPEVKKFIFTDLPTYDNLNFKPIPGAPPQLVIYDKENKEMRRIDLAPFNRNECNGLLKKWGFKPKTENMSEEDEDSEESSREEL